MIEEATLSNNKGQKLAGILHKNKGGGSVTVLLHGFTSTMERTSKILAEYLETTVDCLRFDFTGNGRSEGDFLEGTYKQQVNDVHSAIEFLKTKGYKNFAVIGHSRGGAVAVLSANKDVSAVCALSAVCDTQATKFKILTGKQYLELETKGKVTVKWPWLTFPIDKKFIKDSEETDVPEAAKKIKAPLLVVHGTKDSMVSKWNGLAIFALAQSKEKYCIKIPGADHLFSNQEHRNAMLYAVKDFLEKHFIGTSQ